MNNSNFLGLNDDDDYDDDRVGSDNPELDGIYDSFNRGLNITNSESVSSTENINTFETPDGVVFEVVPGYTKATANEPKKNVLKVNYNYRGFTSRSTLYKNENGQYFIIPFDVKKRKYADLPIFGTVGLGLPIQPKPRKIVKAKRPPPSKMETCPKPVRSTNPSMDLDPRRRREIPPQRSLEEVEKQNRTLKRTKTTKAKEEAISLSDMFKNLGKNFGITDFGKNNTLKQIKRDIKYLRSSHSRYYNLKSKTTEFG